MAGMGIDRSVSHARFSLRRYTVPQLVFDGIANYDGGYNEGFDVTENPKLKQLTTTF
jgi:hypothetical protein